MDIKIPRGTQDIKPGDAEKWQFVEQKAHEICARYNYKEIRTPVFEHTELFQRGVGETTDIVQKEMYTFTDLGDRSLTLRPEGTASVVRSFVENKLYGQAEQPVKLYYTGPMFRYERPQSGRMRQFVQFGIEALGSEDPAVDAEVMALAMDFYEELGLSGLKLVINSLGDQESRKAHREALVNHFEPRISEFCTDCQERLHTNPLRILDCKTDAAHELMHNAPSILDYLSEASTQYFEEVKSLLDEMGVAYVVDDTLVRGLDYYNSTAFEIMLEGEGFGAISTLSGGGRYNGLVEELGGPATPGIGFAMSIERLLMALESQGIELPVNAGLDVYMVTMGEAADRKGSVLLHQLRKAGLKADKDYLGRKPKAQFKDADRKQADITLILGDQELEAGVINVKYMASGEQEEVAIEQLAERLTGGY
ncbi:histidyl-tRNA synthetase [Salsuginibacillus halophilus]|uniref:Histidine--tRNA ligase n=1 Tax=Salsuginibacillus halophilus TaxID=517424 RepID=A0A2P8HFW8_9BACI|nr:histidine--tRNA ligase [Salsuginibacillus halophilus]PSL45105.1 histidyl-tRNA synthetase [Salsuginibacillus halophilus]